MARLLPNVRELAKIWPSVPTSEMTSASVSRLMLSRRN